MKTSVTVWNLQEAVSETEFNVHVTVWNLQEAVSETEFNVQGVPSRSHWWEGGEKVGLGGGRTLSHDTSLTALATESSGAEMTQQNCATLGANDWSFNISTSSLH